MGDEGGGVGTAGGVLENGDGDFDKAVVEHKLTGGLPEFGAADEAVADFGVDVHVNVAATVAFFLIGEAVTAGERAEGFAEEAKFVAKNGEFAGAAFSDFAGSFDEVARVEEFEFFCVKKIIFCV